MDVDLQGSSWTRWKKSLKISCPFWKFTICICARSCLPQSKICSYWILLHKATSFQLALVKRAKDNWHQQTKPFTMATHWGVQHPGHTTEIHMHRQELTSVEFLGFCPKLLFLPISQPLQASPTDAWCTTRATNAMAMATTGLWAACNASTTACGSWTETLAEQVNWGEYSAEWASAFKTVAIAWRLLKFIFGALWISDADVLKIGEWMMINGTI